MVVGAAVLLATGVALAQGRTPAPQQQSAGDKIPGQYIVVLKDDVRDPTTVAQQHARNYGAEVIQTYKHALKGYAARISAERLDEVRADPDVQFVSEDRVVKAFAQTLPTGIDRIEGDASSTASGDGSGAVSNVGAAVIDTGIDLTHPDLNAKNGKNCIRSSKSANDDNGHGSHVAGTIGAKDDTTGVVGVAPGAPLYAVKVLDRNGSGSWSSVACGIDWVTANAASNGIKVANMSLGGGGSDDGNCGNTNNDALHKAICGSVAKGVTYAVAAGNSTEDLKGFVPAAYDEVLSVTALADFNGQPGGGAAATCRPDVDETAADFSNFASTTADQGHTIAAPGVCIRSTWKGGGYNTISGTSMASPHVAGMAALYLAKNSATPAEVITKLRSDAATKSGNDPKVDGYYGFTDDPNSPNGSRYYGYLGYAGGY